MILPIGLSHELSGYVSNAAVPVYRKFYADLRFFNPVRGWCPIVGPSPKFECTQPDSEILSLLESDSTEYVIPVPPQMVQYFSEKIGTFVDVKQFISRSSLAGIIDGVRNAVLDWALKLEEAGVHGEGMSFSMADTRKAQGVTIKYWQYRKCCGAR